MKTKKGIAAGMLVTIMITIVAFMLIAGLIIRYTSKTDEKQAELLCHNSILLRAATMINADGGLAKTEAKVIPVLCKTLDKKVEGDREEIKEQVAFNMARCWWMFNEGRYEEVMDNGVYRKLTGLAKVNNDCFMCYTKMVKSDELKGQPITAPEMFAYMRDQNYPKLKNVTYLNYIQSYGGPGRIAVMDKIEDGKAYGIVFLSKNKDKGNWGILTPVAAGLAVIGTVACIVAEPCGILLAGGTIVALGATGGSIGYSLATQENEMKAKAEFYNTNRENRATSVVAVDNLNALKYSKCLQGDIAGE